jgi:hypothetical protein
MTGQIDVVRHVEMLISKWRDEADYRATAPRRALRECADELEALSALTRAAESQGEAVAWMRDSGLPIADEPCAITNRIRDLWLKVDDKRVERYTIPLFTSAPACDCPGKGKPANLHAPNCPIRNATHPAHGDNAGGGEAPFWIGYLPAPIGNPEAWPENYANGYNDAVRMTWDAVPVEYRNTTPASAEPGCVIRLGADDWNPYELLDIARLHVPANDLLLDRIKECLRQQRTVQFSTDARGGGEAVAYVRWHPLHGYAWGTVHMKDAEVVNGDWRSVPLYTHPTPAALDAERLDWLSQSHNIKNETVLNGYGNLRDRIDAARATTGANGNG